jgi:cytochrome c
MSARRRPSFFVACALAVACACSNRDERLAHELTGGQPSAGKRALERYGCGSCHQIPGVPLAQGHVGPSLRDIAERSYVAGRLPNHPEHLIRWIQHPQTIAPGTAMPELGVTATDARDMAAYLYTLR